MEFVDLPAEVLQFGSFSSWHTEDVNGISGPLSPPAEVLQFGSLSSWQRKDVNGLFGPPLRFKNLGMLFLGIGRI